MSRLKDLRKSKRITQVQMQMLTGIDQSDYSKIENGKRYFTYEQCKRIAIALDTSMDYLAGLTDKKEPYPRKKWMQKNKAEVLSSAFCFGTDLVLTLQQKNK